MFAPANGWVHTKCLALANGFRTFIREDCFSASGGGD